MQIPRAVLVHSATYERCTGVSRNGQEEYEKAVALSFVRFEPVKQTEVQGLGEQRNDRFKLFYDCVNSLPVGLTFSTNDRVTYNGEQFRVRIAQPFFTVRSVPHHVEIALVGSNDD